MHKPILCLDFDGVIHSYSSGWKGADVVPDPPVPGSIEFIRKASKLFRVAIYSSRSGQPGGIDAMRDWLRVAAEAPTWGEGNFTWLDEIEWPTEKPPAMVTIDDRALTFTGDWRDFPLDRLSAFQPWNKRCDSDGSPKGGDAQAAPFTTARAEGIAQSQAENPAISTTPPEIAA